MRPVVVDRIAWSVGLSVRHTSEPCKNGLTDRDAVWVVESGGPREACIKRGAHWRHLANNTEPSVCGGGAAFLSDYVDLLLSLSIELYVNA